MSRPYEHHTREQLDALLKDERVGAVAKDRIRTELIVRGAMGNEAPPVSSRPARVRSMRFCFPLPPNPNQGARTRHWAGTYRENEKWRAVADALVAFGASPEPPEVPYQRVRLTATLYVWQEMDDDNALARVKLAQDWLKTRRYIVDDRKENIEREGVPDQIIDRGCPRLVLRISPPTKGGTTR